ncbi:serine/threonine-protein kinase pdik1l-B-like [Branchiostoma floridae x Branchiostoma belcheri]
MRAHAWENLQLDGYTFGDEIGRGSSSTVYSAKSVATGRTLAAKMLAVEDTSIREICVLTQLRKHPNIVEYRESKVGKDGDRDVLFVISEFCPLGNISDYVLKQQVDLPTKRNLAVQLADAITFLHKNRVVHRDIKPQNVLLTGSEALLVLKVVDFGLVKVLTSSENSVRSPSLLLWAMFDGLSIPGTCEADRYLTPFTGSETDPVPIAQAVTQGNAQLNVVETEENVQCKNLVQRMLSRDRKERPDAQEVLETLIQGYGDHRSIETDVAVKKL